MPVAFASLGEHERELLLVVQQPVRVVRMRGNASDARPQRAEDGQGAEQVLGHAVHRPAQFCLDAVHDRGGVGRNRAGVIGHEERAALGGQMFEALPLGAKPVAVHRVVEPARQRTQVLAASPVIDVAEAGFIALRLGRWLGPRHLHDLAARRREDRFGDGRLRLLAARRQVDGHV